MKFSLRFYRGNGFCSAKRVVKLWRATFSIILIAVTTANAATVVERLAPCIACHGEKGESVIAEVPSLGGQPAFYLSVQLLMLREGIRRVEPMTALMKGWSDDDLRQASEILAKQPPPPPKKELLDLTSANRARQLIQQQRCDFCHKPDFSGEQIAPRLAGQREDYLRKALRDYKNNSRPMYDTSMADAIQPLSEVDIQDLVHYLARLE